ncbi:MAG: NIPSNAP family protein [Caulobacteraceae bacterium]
MVFLQATIELRGAGLGDFLEIMGEAVPILEKQGMKLVCALIQRTGRLNTVIDLWQLDDFNHFDRALAVLAAHKDFERIKEVLDRTIERETLVFAAKAPYMR